MERKPTFVGRVIVRILLLRSSPSSAARETIASSRWIRENELKIDEKHSASDDNWRVKRRTRGTIRKINRAGLTVDTIFLLARLSPCIQ